MCIVHSWLVNKIVTLSVSLQLPYMVKDSGGLLVCVCVCMCVCVNIFTKILIIIGWKFSSQRSSIAFIVRGIIIY